MAGLVPAIHAAGRALSFEDAATTVPEAAADRERGVWMGGSSPAMTQAIERKPVSGAPIALGSTVPTRVAQMSRPRVKNV